MIKNVTLLGALSTVGLMLLPQTGCDRTDATKRAEVIENLKEVGKALDDYEAKHPKIEPVLTGAPAATPGMSVIPLPPSYQDPMNSGREMEQKPAETEIAQPGIHLVIKGPYNVQVGDEADFLLRVENRFDQPLENVEITIAYDPGLVRPGRSNPAKIRLVDNGSIQVSQSESFPFTAIAKGTGKQCLTVTVTADGVRPERQTAYVNINDTSGGDKIVRVED